MIISSKRLTKLIPGITIKKTFKDSGQKQVFLVNYGLYTNVILKVVKPGNARVEREIEIITENNIVNVPKILEVINYQDDDPDLCFLLIFEEYIDGSDLRSFLEQRKLSSQEGLKLLRDLLEITVQLENLKIVHRDIKPDNIILSNSGDFYLIDFGIARSLNATSLTFTEVAHGPHTPGYGPPELINYKKSEIDSRTDLYSIGVVAYEALAGKHPYISGNESDLPEIWYATQTVLPQDFFIEGDCENQLISFIQILMDKYVTRRPPTAKKALEWFNTVCKSLSVEV
ncbi:MAG: serine/threonine protein kinase [Firmicutes bacterium HGW-Firmicutes-4]|jgi:serine/threonine-protein kinase|nr:MAG: serine/threonine protein kinase [Ignavibacteriae bacterium HGW-Ignavibacteriae-4]PKM61393.1 MAG: serine/threonine protein kinase [Firmicutes bacterium HGW-Firmicutes-4]